MGMGSPAAESMFRMTQMLEMNSMMLDQLQEHVSMTYNRLRDVAMWIWALKSNIFPSAQKTQAAIEAEQQQEPPSYESADAKQDELQRVKSRVRVLLVLAVAFLFFVLRDTWR